MPKVTFLPMNKVCDVKKGQSLLDIALEFDIPIQCACGGFCACTTCHVKIQSGDQNLSTMQDDEMDRLEKVGARSESSRLGCQAKVQGDVILEVVNLDDL